MNINTFLDIILETLIVKMGSSNKNIINKIRDKI